MIQLQNNFAVYKEWFILGLKRCAIVFWVGLKRLYILEWIGELQLTEPWSAKIHGSWRSTKMKYIFSRDARKHTKLIESERQFGLIGQDITQINQINQLEDLNFIGPLPALKGQPARMKLKPDAKPMFCFTCSMAKKKDGSLQLYADYKLHVNGENIMAQAYSSPGTDTFTKWMFPNFLPSLICREHIIKSNYMMKPTKLVLWIRLRDCPEWRGSNKVCFR